VQDGALIAALLQAYHTLLMVGRFPLAVLFVTIPPEDVDVNVHPAKAEVRFRSSETVFSAVQRAARRALLAHSPVPGLDAAGAWRSTQPMQGWGSLNSGAVGLDWGMAAEASSPDETGGADVGDETGPTTAPALVQTALPSGAMPLLRLVGQVGAAYLVAEGPDGLYLIDQHAAHERVLFERLMAQRGAVPSQALLDPALVQLTPSQASVLIGQETVLEKIGFEIEPFGPATFRVRAVPAVIRGSDPAAALRVVVEDFEEDEAPLQAEIEAKVIARVCKRAAVKAGQTLSAEEQKALLRDLESCQSPRTCPHGRATMIHLSVDLLERQFGRKGAR